MQPAKIDMPELIGVAAMLKEEANASRSRFMLTTSLSLLIISCQLTSYQITWETIIKTCQKFLCLAL